MTVQSRVIPEWPEWQSPETAAKYLDTAEQTLADWRCKGVGPAFKKIGQRMVRYRKEDLDAYMMERG
ncbi:helix-turn-helix domain-containing protein [Rhodobacter sp. Har01]|uniref:helix-turn-helix domain-containing protein n=1 Tax=Rhodobacter sp. Har01 TaxID=2883999 RepID=UPI001D08A446|nr:helix-turn-helix domain-containing protein [Rhodobacter sp. Har01]MCB6177531.1 helix-turn-helix domain-containing protein [Rhodobacter sp. Har01]